MHYHLSTSLHAHKEVVVGVLAKATLSPFDRGSVTLKKREAQDVE
jgi:hypothetical protein